MRKLLIATERINQLGAWIGGALLFLTSFLIGVEVILRKVFTVSLGGADELSSYALAISCSWAFGFALLRKAHIRIDVFTRRLPSRLQAVLDLLSLLVFLVYLLPLTYFAWLVLHTSIIRNSAANTPLQTPLWIPQGLWFAGLLLFLATTLILFGIGLHHFLKGDIAGGRKLIGPTTLEDEIEEECGSLVSEQHERGGA